MFDWHTHLCEYYNVTKEEALQLGTRSSGRKPNLPGSITCSPVSNKTFEDIWAEKDRNSIQSVFDFYKDQGAWSTFRQCVRHKDMVQLHLTFLQFLSDKKALHSEAHLCEYGAGVAPFMTTLLKNIRIEDKDFLNLTITIVDVDCEHLNFAKYRLNRIKEEKGLNGVTLDFKIVTPDTLPKFSKPLDALFCFEVLEHVPSPVNVINNIKNNMKAGGFYIENFIKHDATDDDDGPDLLSARNEREEYYNILDKFYNLLYPTPEESIENPSVTRIWQRNLLNG